MQENDYQELNEETDDSDSLFSDDTKSYDSDLEKNELEQDERERILSIQDISEIGPDEYLVFVNYSIAQIHSILRTKIKAKIPDNEKIKEMASDAIGLAITTYDLEKAIESKAAFRTHLGWKAMQVVTDYAREFEKASRNELNTSDDDFASSLEENKIQSDIDGNIDVDKDVDMMEHHNSDKTAKEQGKKIEWAIGHVRFELPRESNLILDVGIGEILKEDDSAYSLPEWADFTGQDIRSLRALFIAAKKLIKQKLHRKGFM